MRLESITFAEHPEQGALPATVTVEMTVEEAMWAAQLSGKQRGESPHNGVFDCLIGDVFNRYWDDGIDGALRVFSAPIPPLGYEGDDS